MGRWVLATACAFGAIMPAAAQDIGVWSVSPPVLSLGDWTLSLDGQAGGSFYCASGSGNSSGADLAGLVFPHIERLLDNGWEVGARGTILAYHDRLAGDIYGDRAIEKVYLFAQTPYGRLELGQSDGGAYRLAATGPHVDEEVAVDGAATTFFRDPTSGRALIDMFRLESAEFATVNDAKFTYLSPRLHGLRFGASYTPRDARGGLPFLSRGRNGPDDQSRLLEAAANYTGSSQNIVYTFYAGAVRGEDERRTPGHAGLADWGIGGEADTTIGIINLAFGAAFRSSNARAFDIADARTHGMTQSWRIGTTATAGPWIGGFEYAEGRADDAAPEPGLRERGFEPSLGYVVNSNVQLTCGWQQLRFMRSSGLFFNGGNSARLDAGFLYLRFQV